MINSYFEPDWTAKVTVPVRRVGDRWEFFYGGDVPVREGTLGVLTFDADQITDESFRERVAQEVMVKILDEGTELLVALSDKDTNGAHAGEWPQSGLSNVPPGTTRFERIWLGPVKRRESEQLFNSDGERGGLWLKLKGLERCELQGSSVRMPSGLPKPFAISLNHAFTMLSQTYEKHRISNTGNVYTRVFYKERNGTWYPIDDLRRGVQAEVQRELLQEAWAEVERLLGWRPAPPPVKRRRR